MPESIQNVRGSMLRPAHSKRLRKVTRFFCSDCCFSRSFRSAVTFLRRCALSCVLRPVAIAAGAPETEARRFFDAPAFPAKARPTPPRARTANITVRTRIIARLSLLQRVQRFGKLAVEIVVPGAFPERRAHDAGSDM